MCTYMYNILHVEDLVLTFNRMMQQSVNIILFKLKIAERNIYLQQNYNHNDKP